MRNGDAIWIACGNGRSIMGIIAPAGVRNRGHPLLA